MMKKTLLILVAFSTAAAWNARAWDYEGHRAVNQLALVALPADFPAFVKTPEAEERIAFLAGEPDRWRNLTAPMDVPQQHVNGPDHYLDLEQLADYGMTPDSVPWLRYDFVAKLALARAAHPEKFEPIDPAKDKDHTRELVGFLPWAITENFLKLKSEFSYLKTFEHHGGTTDEIANAQANINYTMGVMGHYVGDSSQPLHVTKHHHGWVGPNPDNFSTNFTFHAWIDGGYFRKIGGIQLDALTGKIKPATSIGDPAQPESFFRAMMDHIVAQNKMVALLYQLEKDHKLTPHDGQVDAEGRDFLYRQLVTGGQLLGNIWFTAWQDSTDDKYLAGELEKRRAAAVPAK